MLRDSAARPLRALRSVTRSAGVMDSRIAMRAKPRRPAPPLRIAALARDNARPISIVVEASVASSRKGPATGKRALVSLGLRSACKYLTPFVVAMAARIRTSASRPWPVCRLPTRESAEPSNAPPTQTVRRSSIVPFPTVLAGRQAGARAALRFASKSSIRSAAVTAKRTRMRAKLRRPESLSRTRESARTTVATTGENRCGRDPAPFSTCSRTLPARSRPRRSCIARRGLLVCKRPR